MKCNIENFYPSISEKLLSKAILWAKTITFISETAIDVIFCARKNVLYDGTDIWVKKQNAKFDIGMGSYDGAECAELVGLYLLNRMIFEDQIFKLDEVVLYRDDLLAMVEVGGPSIERKRKALIKLCKEEGLTVTSETNLDRVKFLDVLFDLKEGSYKPYHKANSKVQYVSAYSNHPKIVLENIPIGINQRLTNISSDKGSFDSEKELFQQALLTAGHTHKLDYNNTKRKRKVGHTLPRINQHQYINENHNNNKCQRNIIWYNPPFNLYCDTNVGREFRNLIKKHFLRGTDLGKLFNPNKLKLSYSCLPNLKFRIAAHNRHILFGETGKIEKSQGCNCHNAEDCPMNGDCMVSDIIYQAEVLKEGQKG